MVQSSPREASRSGGEIEVAYLPVTRENGNADFNPGTFSGINSPSLFFVKKMCVLELDYISGRGTKHKRLIL